MRTLHKNQTGFSVVEAVMLLVIVGLIAVIGYHVWQTHKNADKTAASNSSQAATSSTESKPLSDICYLDVASNQLDCVDSSGQNLVSHQMPTLGGNKAGYLVSNATDTQYIYDSGSLWVLDASLHTVKQLNLPANLNYNPGTVSWSRDGKSLFLELDSQGPGSDTRHIYNYDIATGTIKQITTGANSYSPYQTADGHLLYQQFTPAGTGGWLPYIANADGSNPQALTALAPDFAGISYDSASDTVFIANFASDGTGNGSLAYETIPDVLRGASPKTVSLDVETSGGGLVTRVDNNTILWPNSSEENVTNGQFVNLNSGTVIYTLPDYGVPVGKLPNVGAIH